MCPQSTQAWLLWGLSLGTVPGPELKPSWPQKYELNLNYIQSTMLPVAGEDCPSPCPSKCEGTAQAAELIADPHQKSVF